MYDFKNILYLISAISSIEKIFLYTNEFNSPLLFLEANHQMNFNASVNLLISVAEEIKKMDKKLFSIQPDISWKNIINMRNILVHDYRGVDSEIVFDVIKSELPCLKSALIKIIKILPESKVKDALNTHQYKHLRAVIF